MMPIVAVDAAATSAVWMGAYTKKLGALQGAYVGKAIQADNQHHQEAVDYADSVVKQSTPDYDPSSRSGILRAQNAYRLVNNVSSAITLFAQRHKHMYTARSKGKVSLSQLARFEMYYTLLPALAVFLLLALARGFFTGNDDEGQGPVKLFVSTGFDFASMRLPILGV